MRRRSGGGGAGLARGSEARQDRDPTPITKEPAMQTMAIMTPGDMGHAVGAQLRRHGLRVITNLEGRSARTRELAAQAGIEPVADDQSLVREADALLAILVPAKALDLAQRIAPALERTGRALLYVECNAIAPESTRRAGAVIEAAGGRFVDAGIIGPPPRADGAGPRIYASGAHAQDLAALRDFGLDVRVIGPRVGDASAVKMCYAALTKGTTALLTQLSVAAERLGVSDVLRAELASSQAAMLERMRGEVPRMIPKAHRWVGEMAEIAATFEAAGLTPRTFEGAAELYAFVAGTALARTSPEAWRADPPGFAEVIARLARDRG
jgi:3-hydroxyisobutyrate dehydrogenase-like beta-hydroxyacid dehydrogenase